MVVTEDHLFGAGMYASHFPKNLIANHEYSSTRNCHIERLWVEVGAQFARRWRAFFMRLEHTHMLNPGDPNHLWLLHALFLDDIDEDCQAFRDEWNCHPISGPGTNNKSPQVSVACYLFILYLMIPNAGSTLLRPGSFWVISRT